MKKYLPILLAALFLPRIVSSDEKMIPPSHSDLLNLPSEGQRGSPSSPREEIEALWKAGERKKALRQLNQWMSKEKDSPVPWVVAASFECAQNNFKHCVNRATKAIYKSPEYSEAYYWKGKGLEGLQKKLEAANEYKAALSGPRKYLPAQEDLDRVSRLLENEK